MSVQSGTSFSVSSDYVAATAKFDNNTKPIVYVEGFEDINFWKQRYLEVGFEVEVKAICSKSNANGKDAILKGVRDKDLELGPYLMVAIDSDLDYLLDNNQDVFQEEFVLQTYAYSIENLIWHPSRVMAICNHAACCDVGLTNEEVVLFLENWSSFVYPYFIHMLVNNDGKIESEVLLNQLDINNLLVGESLTLEIGNICPDQEEKLVNKGLTQSTVYLFVRGHDYGDKLIELCKRVTREAKSKTIRELKESLGNDKAGQFVSSYCNQCHEVERVAEQGSISCELCLPLIQEGILKIKKSYH